MAVATPVIERKVYTQNIENDERQHVSADERHNARMRDNLARLLNPENKIKDVVASIDADGSQVIKAEPVREQAMQQTTYAQPAQAYAPAAQPAQQTYGQHTYAQPAQQPAYMVRGARADADIFRADSPVNAMHATTMYASTPAEAYAAAKAQAAAISAAQPRVEEENEDLRPTPTTIQYQTIGANGVAISDSAARVMQEGEISRPAERAEKRLSLSKRDKIVMGVIIGLILAVFVLIIVNSAVISNLSADITYLEGQYEAARAAYETASAELNELTSFENVYKVALEQGWLLG